MFKNVLPEFICHLGTQQLWVMGRSSLSALIAQAVCRQATYRKISGQGKKEGIFLLSR